MSEIKTETQYLISLDRIEELLLIVGNETAQDNQYFIELDLLSDIVAEYEEKHHPIPIPSEMRETL